MDQLTLFAEAFRANPLARPVADLGRKTIATSGLKCCGLLRKQSRLGSLAKMLLVSEAWGSKIVPMSWKAETLPVTATKTITRHYTHDRKKCCSTVSVKTLRTSVSRSSRLLFQLQVHGRNIDETGYGLLPTPKVTGTENAETVVARKGYQKALSHNLLAAVQLLPTPRANDGEKRGNFKNDRRHGLPAAAKFWPTLQATDNRDRGNLGSGAVKKRMAAGKQLMLSQVVDETSGQLNPNWVEWLMGYPIGWTDLSV